MPIYEYQCGACGHKMDKLQNMSDEPLTDCPECEKPELKKMISAAGFRLKGAGWYETDFKSSATSTKSAKPAADSQSSASKSADSKPASS